MNVVREIDRINQKELSLEVNEKISWHADYADSAYIYVGNLDYALTEGDIRAIFSQYGEIVHIDLIRDKSTGQSKGFAFICYEDQRSTNVAVDNFNGIQLIGRTLRVDHVRKYRKPKKKKKGSGEEEEESDSEEEQRKRRRLEKELKELKKERETEEKEKAKEAEREAAIIIKQEENERDQIQRNIELEREANREKKMADQQRKLSGLVWTKGGIKKKSEIKQEPKIKGEEKEETSKQEEIKNKQGEDQTSIEETNAIRAKLGLKPLK